MSKLPMTLATCRYDRTEALRSGEIGVSEPLVAVLLQSRDQMSALLEEVSTGTSDPAARLALRKEDRSILDSITDEVTRLRGVLGAPDRRKIDQYLGRLIMNSPDWESVEVESLHTNRIVPVYSLTERITRLGYPASLRGAERREGNTERRALLIKMGVALFLMKNLMLFSYALYIGYFQELPPEILALFPKLLFALAIPSVFWCAIPIHRKAWQSLRALSPTMELLFSMGIFAAFSYSSYELFSGGSHFYFDTAGSLVGLLLVGKFVEMSVKHKTSESINRLYQMMPKKVRLKAPEGERLVSIEKLQVGDRFIVRSGEKIPADGTVREGRAVVDESLLTGESKPLEKSIGGSVIASSMNVNGVLEIEATRVGDQTTLSAIIRMVESALSSKSELERSVDRIARVFIPAIIVLASLGFGGVILSESSLSFLGYGIPPPTPTWGGMLANEGRSYMFSAPWMLIAPTAALGIVVFGINVFGDALRDVLDPRLRGS
mgnify:CR=1 FL=1